MSDYKIQKISLLDKDDVKNREVAVTLDNGTEIHIGACHESWEQWNGTRDELYTTVDVAEHYNAWLHGGSDPGYPYWLMGEEEEKVTSESVVDFFKETGLNLFGSRTEEIARAIADEVVDEYVEAGDGDLRKAISYVLLDKLGCLE